MRLRAILLGLVGAVFIATVGYFAARVAHVNRFVCGQFPIIVYGPLVLVALLVNPVLARFRRQWSLRPAELGVIIVVTLAACSIPSNGLLRYFTRCLVMPVHLNTLSPGWRDARLLEDVPPAMLANHGRYDKALTEGFIAGLGSKGQPIGIAEVPWAQWSGTLAFWGSVMFLLAMASICVALIVHPQWSKREWLRYPIAVFADAMLDPGEPGKSVPTYRRPWFRVAVVLMLLYHAVNGLYAWWPQHMVRIPLAFDFSALTHKFTWLRYGWGGMTMGRPAIWPTAVAMAFFLARDVTFSVGISQPLATILGALLLELGLTRPEGDYIAGGTFQWQRAGSCVALAIVLLYFGRAYYSRVLKQAVTFGRATRETEPYAVWACRALLLCIASLLWILCRYAGLEPVTAIAFVFLTLLAYLAVARITAEFGMFYVQVVWLPVTVLLGFFGARALGPTAMIALGMLSTVFVLQPEESLMTFVLTGLKIGGARGLPAGKAGWAAAGGVVLALAAAIPFALWVDYSFGGATSGGWDWDGYGAPSMPFRSLERAKADLRFTGELGQSEGMTSWQRIVNMRPDRGFLASAALGFLAVSMTYVLRLRYPWWPLHPIMFLVWETWASAVFFHSFLLAWLIQMVLSRMGTQATRGAVQDAMVGVIAGELMAGMSWMCVGGVYYAATGISPRYYSIFPY